MYHEDSSALRIYGVSFGCTQHKKTKRAKVRRMNLLKQLNNNNNNNNISDENPVFLFCTIRIEISI